MRKNLLLLLLSVLMISNLTGQEKKFEVDIHGFVGFDAMHDTRRVKSARHNHILLYALPEKLDANGKDLNDNNEFDMGALISRFNIQVKGPTVNGISTFAMVEGDFTAGVSGGDGEFLTRHAYMQLGYSKVSLIAGQTWHPFFMTENFPQTLNAGVGVPIHPLSRNAQIRFTYKPTAKLEISATVLEQAAFRSAGFPKGTEEAAMPEFVLQMKAGGTGAIWGSLTGGYKTLAVPYAIEGTPEPTTFGSYHLSASLRVKTKYLTARAGTIYGGNLTEHAMIGGVGKKASSTVGNPEYQAQYTHSLWMDLSTTVKNIETGFFLGNISNLGASDNIILSEKDGDNKPDLGRDTNIGNLLMITPRIRYLIGSHVWVGIEHIYSVAGYGFKTDPTDPTKQIRSYDAKGKPTNLKNFTTNRTQLSFRYTF